ncbi:hypothetical protein Tco_0707619 [Tanacetum coccineum]|uniref:Uncharacterized protein n=1 Tax=Tanacetum coccineum TaxID=301880 RepID=A0ABQ4YD02_9ASTR
MYHFQTTHLEIGIRARLTTLGFHLIDPTEFEAHGEAPQSPGQAPPSSDYVPSPEHPPSPDYVPGPEYPKYVAPTDDEIPIVDASPTALSPGYIADSDPSKEDPVEEEESFEDGDNEEEDKASKEDEDEEEEHLASADSAAATPPPPRSPQTRYASTPTRPSPPPSPLSPLSSPLPRILSPPLHTSPTYADAPLGYRAAMI